MDSSYNRRRKLIFDLSSLNQNSLLQANLLLAVSHHQPNLILYTYPILLSLSFSVRSDLLLFKEIKKKKTQKQMSRFWTLLTYLHSLAGPGVMLLYPLYASVVAIESTSKLDDEQWLAYWILYSFLTLMEMLLQTLLEWIPIWYTVKLAFVAWLVLPQFRGAAFIYEKFVREKLIKKYGAAYFHKSSPNGKGKKFVDFLSPKKAEHEAS